MITDYSYLSQVDWNQVIDPSGFDGVFESYLSEPLVSNGSTLGFVESGNLSNAQANTDVQNAAIKAAQTGNTKLLNTLNYILKYGDVALGILSKYGVLKNKNLVSNAYGLDITEPTNATKDPNQAIINGTGATTTQKTGIDLTNPTTLIIIFLILLVFFAFIFSLTKTNQSSTKSK